VKNNWNKEELEDFFSFSSEEIKFLVNKNEATRLGFAILFKFFQNESRFPKYASEVPKTIIAYISNILAIDSQLFLEYDWNGRTIKRHRAEIRQIFSFEETKLSDLKGIKEWLIKSVIPENTDFEYSKERVFQKLKTLKLEPPSDLQIDRMIKSAIKAYENTLYNRIYSVLNKETISKIDLLIVGNESENDDNEYNLSFKDFKKAPEGINVDSSLYEIEKLKSIEALHLPEKVFKDISEKIVEKFYRRVNAEELSEVLAHPNEIKYSLLYIFFMHKKAQITDNLSNLLSETIHKLESKAESKLKNEYISQAKKGKLFNKKDIAIKLAQAALDNPEGRVKDVIYSVIDKEALKNFIEELQNSDKDYDDKSYKIIRASYQRNYRQAVPKIISVLDFNSNNDVYKPMIEGLSLIKKYSDSKLKHFPKHEKVAINGVIKPMWQERVFDFDKNSEKIVNRINYEICLLESLRDKMRCREIWVKNSNKYKNPDEDIPFDFDEKRDFYYSQLDLTTDARQFISTLKEVQKKALETLNNNILGNNKVTLKLNNGKGHIKLSPLEPQAEPRNLALLKTEILNKWNVINLLDILKESDLRLNFTKFFKSTAANEKLSRDIIQRRLILSLYSLATNTGLKGVSSGTMNEKHLDLFYVKTKFIDKENLRNAISHIVNETLKSRNEAIWGTATTTCASDSKKFGAWNQNLMTEWHNRYHGRGIMIYWHVELGSVCVYSQLKSCSSSEVSAMIEGILRHNTEMEIEKHYVDTHGQSEVAFAFCHLLGFKLMPRLKNISKQKLYRPDINMTDSYSNLQNILTRPINWEIIEQQYDQMVKYATALRLGTAETESILKRFTGNNLKHPTYQALNELGKVIKTIFICEYLDSEKIRREIHEGLNVIENWNSANNFIFYGKGREFSTNKIEEQEISALSLQLLQNSLIYINTLLIQNVLSEKVWYDKMTKEDFRALTPLIYSHINPYGTFNLDMDKRIELYEGEMQ